MPGQYFLAVNSIYMYSTFWMSWNIHEWLSLKQLAESSCDLRSGLGQWPRGAWLWRANSTYSYIALPNRAACWNCNCCTTNHRDMSLHSWCSVTCHDRRLYCWTAFHWNTRLVETPSWSSRLRFRSPSATRATRRTVFRCPGKTSRTPPSTTWKTINTNTVVSRLSPTIKTIADVLFMITNNIGKSVLYQNMGTVRPKRSSWPKNDVLSNRAHSPFFHF